MSVPTPLRSVTKPYRFPSTVGINQGATCWHLLKPNESMAQERNKHIVRDDEVYLFSFPWAGVVHLLLRLSLIHSSVSL